jgi:Tol biopolymer transport system component
LGASRPLRSAAALLALAAFLRATPAAAKFDPAQRWRTAETPHFVIHFPDGCAAEAARAAAIAEDVHGLLAPRVRWEPRARTRLILLDDDDAAAGWATPYPYNQMAVSLTPPLGEPGFGTTAYDDWLRLVVTHEYTHVLQLDMASGLPLALRGVFGRLYFPNALQPEWLIEGLAVREETALTTGGRGRSPGSEMVLRMAALGGTVPTLDRMAVFPDDWPAGEVPYLFGESFLRFLEERFGRGKTADLSVAYGGRWLPYLVESTGLAVLGRSYRDLWEEWSRGLQASARGQAAAIEARGVTASTALTGSGFHTAAPAWSPDGTRIAWLQADDKAFPGVWLMNADGSDKRRLVKSVFPTSASGESLAWSPDGARLYFTKPGFERGVAVRNDIWAWDLRAQREVRVTRGLRARDPSVSPDGSKLLLVTSGRGRTRLGVLDLAAGALPVADPARIRFLTEASGEQLAAPRWSPDGTRIAVSVRTAGGQTVRVLDAAGGRVAESPRDGALAGAPSWSPDGRRVYFATDRTGVFNLHAWEPATGALAQVTNVLGGAFMPSPSPDGRALAFCDYSARGFDIRVMPVDPGSWRAAPVGEAAPAAPAGTEPEPIPSRAYSPLSTLLPRLWAPQWATGGPEGTQLGLITGGQDAVQHHRYLLTALYGTQSHRLSSAVSYAYDGWRPTLGLLAADFEQTYGGFLHDGQGTADYTERERAAGADLVYDFPGFTSSRAFSLGLRYRELSALVPLPPWPGYAGELPARGSLGSARLGWSFSNAERPTSAISPERGRRVALALELFRPVLASDFAYTRYTLDWNEYLPLPRERHVLDAALFLGHAAGDVPPQGAYQLGGDTPGDLWYGLDDRAVGLRGYPPNAFHGDNALLARLEYRFPLLEVGRGGVSLPLYLRRVHGAVFVEAGEAWDETFRRQDLRRSVGAEARLDLFGSYILPLTLRAGIAAGLDQGGTTTFTVGLWLAEGLFSSLKYTGDRARRYDR